jgi:hypothetical protein
LFFEVKAMNNWVSIFGGSSLAPATVQYLAIVLTANVGLVWPLESAEGQNYLAQQLDVTPSGAGLAITMPPANQGSTGITTVATNLGTTSFAFLDNGGTQIVVIAPGESWVISLTSNATAAGTWEAFKLGAGAPSGSIASALAGAGLQAIGVKLQSFIATNIYTTNQLLSTAHRATADVWQGVTGTFTLDLIATVTAGWWAIIQNEGTGVLTVATSGADTIDGAASITLPVSGAAEGYYSTMIVAAAGGYHTYFLPPIPTPISAGGTGATTAAQALTNFGGTPFGISIFTAPSAATVLGLLGLPNSIFTEDTISTSTVVGTSASGICYVCTAPLTLTLPQAATITDQFYFTVYAQGGAVTITPNAADMINGAALGASLVVSEGSSLFMVTDAGSPAGNWWPFFLNIPASGAWAAASGTVNVITAAYSPANTALTDGLLLGFRASGANTSTTPTFAPDGLTAHTIVKYNGLALAAGDIPGNLYECLVRYNLANTWWELLNPAPTSVLQSTWIAAGGTSDVIVGTYVPAISALYDGLLLGLRASAANATTTPTFSPSGLSAHTITKVGGVALSVGDIASANHELLLRYNLGFTRWELLNPALPPASMGGGSSGSGAHAGLKITNGGTPNHQAAVTATSVTVSTGAGAQLTVSPVNVTPDITVSGANGLDTGSVAASTFYSIWVIWNGSAAAGLFSVSPNAPSLPGGYTYSARVGWMVTDGSGNLMRTLQYGNRVRYTLPPLPILASGVSGSITVPTWTAVSVSGFVPSTAAEIGVNFFGGVNNEESMVAPNNSYGAWNSTTNPPPLVVGNQSDTNFFSQTANLLLESTNIFYASNGSHTRLTCYGWTDNL